MRWVHPMNIRRLQHLVALADEGNFRRAAERVHLSQPAFSRSIQAAEAELGLKLFDRGTLEVKTTPAGAFVVDRARRLLQQTRNLERDVSLYRERAIGDIAFGSGPFPAASLVPALLADLRRHYPGVSVCVHVNNAHHLLGYVRREEHEFFVANAVDVPRDGIFHVERIGQMPGGFYVREGHPLLDRNTVSTADLVPFGIASGRLPRETTALLLKLMGLPPDQKLPIAVECDDIHLLKRVALDSDTVIIGSPDLLAEDLRRKVIQEVVPADLPQQHSQLGVVTLAGRTPSPVAAYAMQFLARAAKERLNAK
jgi:DNA-binding transcriptional LysR family regulator